MFLAFFIAKNTISKNKTMNPRINHRMFSSVHVFIACERIPQVLKVA